MKNLIDKIINKTRYIISYTLANIVFVNKVKKQNNSFNIMSDDELIDKIVKERKSFARFGDGEFSLILNPRFSITFQDNSTDLNKRLKEVLSSNQENLILGISRSLNDPKEYNRKTQKYFNAFNYMYRKKYMNIIPCDKEYGNSSITRFYIDYDNKDIEPAKKRLKRIKRIWNNRDIIIVEGIHTKIGVGNDLLDNAMSIKRILIPERNAFRYYQNIIECIINNAHKNDLILLAAGPTATVLAYDLAKNNIQAIDIGHVDIEYEWMLMGAKKRVPIRGKYVNEVKGEKYTSDHTTNDEYNQSIITVIGSCK